MKFSALVFGKILLLLLVFGKVKAQVPKAAMDSIAKHAFLYGKQKDAPALFLHVDKTVYVNNEVIWFAAYLLNPGKNFTNHQIISVSLINNITQNVVSESKFPMRGFAHGNIIVRDTVSPGDYSLVAITNMSSNQKPVTSFLQPITIKSVKSSTFGVALTLDTLYKDPEMARVLLTASNGTEALEGVEIEYYLGKDSKTRVVGKAKTNVLGSYTILIPKNRINGNQHKLAVQAKYQKVIKSINIDIPVKEPLTDLKFYPEGGYMVAGLSNRISWEAKTPGGAPLKAKVRLYENEKQIKIIEADSYGLGQFELNPVAGKTYTARLTNIRSDSVYQLPVVLSVGLTVRANNAVVNDTLELDLKSTNPGKFTVLVHNYKNLFSALNLSVESKSHHLKIGLPRVPRGLATVTILDEQQRPLSEHMFFAHYKRSETINVSVDAVDPGLRQKLNVKLKLNAAFVNKSKALVSVSVAQDNRYETRKENNIEHYYYILRELDRFQLNDNIMGQGVNQLKYLNDLLLVRGWSKYNWLEMLRSSELDTVKTYQNLTINGQVLYRGRQADIPIKLSILKDSSDLKYFKSDSSGFFAFNNSQIFVRKNDPRIRLTIMDEPAGYAIILKDPYLELQRRLAQAFEPEIFDIPVTKDTREFVFNAPGKVTNLREVQIRAKNDKSVHGSNACGDYVCRYNILNCFNHPDDSGNLPPEIGKKYVDALTGQLVQYEGCDAPSRFHVGKLVFKGVYNSREYYGTDYAKSNPLEPDYLSTLLWKHDVILNADGEVTIPFYTSDITGKFRVVVQGVTNDDVVYGETSFEVKEVKKSTP